MGNDKINKGGRPNKVVIKQQGKMWTIRFTKNDGTRVRKSCKTKDEQIAIGLAKQIEWLLVNPKCSVTAKAYELFFGDLPEIPSTEEDLQTVEHIKDDSNKSFVIQTLMREVSALKAQLKIALPFEAMYKAFSKTREGRVIMAADSLPTIGKALKEYAATIQHVVRPNSYVRPIKKFFKDHLDKKLDEIKPIEIQHFLTENCASSSQRWHAKRKYFIQFYNRMTSLYHFESPMPDVMDKKPEHKTDIQYHTIKEVNKFLKTLENDYDKALFSTLFFAGTSASELRGLTVMST